MPTPTGLTLVTASLEARRATTGKSAADDLKLVDDCLSLGSRFLMRQKQNVNTPNGWDSADWVKYATLTKKQRLVEAATLLIAQIDVLISKEG